MHTSTNNPVIFIIPILYPATGCLGIGSSLLFYFPRQENTVLSHYSQPCGSQNKVADFYCSEVLHCIWRDLRYRSGFYLFSHTFLAYSQ